MTEEKVRCFGTGDELYERYHDTEWGRPLAASPDERELFERIVLEGFQSGLSWLTILRKREAFRSAFDGFAPGIVARYGADDVARLLSDARIVRNRLKVNAAVANAQALVQLHETGGQLASILDEHRPPPRARAATLAELPTRTPESEELAKRLKGLGFRFVGPTTMYALMQAVGIVDDHLAGCWLARRE